MEYNKILDAGGGKVMYYQYPTSIQRGYLWMSLLIVRGIDYLVRAHNIFAHAWCNCWPGSNGPLGWRGDESTGLNLMRVYASTVRNERWKSFK